MSGIRPRESPSPSYWLGCSLQQSIQAKDLKLSVGIIQPSCLCCCPFLPLCGLPNMLLAMLLFLSLLFPRSDNEQNEHHSTQHPLSLRILEGFPMLAEAI